MIEFFIAKKHIIERKKQSIVAMLGILIGLTVLTVSLAISNGLNNNMINSVLSISPHILVNSGGYRIEEYEKKIEEISKIEGIKGVVPKYTNQGILKAYTDFGVYQLGVQIDGVNLESAKSFMGLDNYIVEGEIHPDKYNEILLGSEMQAQLGVKIGDVVELTSSENKKMKLKVGGVFRTGFISYDSSLVIMPLKTTQILSDSGDAVTSLDVILNNPYDASKLRKNVIDLIRDLRIQTWGDINSNLLKALSLEKTVMVVLFSLIIIIAGFVIGVVLNTMVREKTKDIGILRSMGYSRNSIMKIFVIEGFVLGGTGIVLGLAVSFVLLSLLKMGLFDKLTEIYYLTSIPVRISLGEVILIVAATMTVVLVSSIFPAYRGANLTPVEALKHE